MILVLHYKKHDFKVKDFRGWQFLTLDAAETLCMVYLPPEEHFSEKNIWGNQPFKKSHFVRV